MISLRLYAGPVFVLTMLLFGCGSGEAVEGVEDGQALSGGDVAVAEPTDLAGATGATVSAETVQAINVAEAFMEARDKRDTDGLLALLDPDVVVHDFGRWTRTYDEYPALIEWMDIFDWRWDLQECSEVISGPPVRVACRHLMENDWSRAQGADPVAGQIDLVVDGDLIVEVDSDLGQWVPIVFAPWMDWLDDQHSADIPVLFLFDEDDNLKGGPATDPEALELYRQYRTEYIASFESPDADS